MFELGAAIALRKQVPFELLLALSGIASSVFSILMAVWPAAGALALVGLIAAYSIVSGILLIGLGSGCTRCSGRTRSTWANPPEG